MKLLAVNCLTVLILLTQCTLSGQREDLLNNRLNAYLHAVNTNNTLQLVAFTEVSVVRYYKDKGDQPFLATFHQSDSLEKRCYYDNPINLATKVQNNWIERKYAVEKYTKTTDLNSEYCIFALSEDGGNNWFFVNEDDYFNDQIPIKKRLFKN
jgi:hypothetical protein